MTGIGVVKTCTVCNVTFTTRTSTTGEWETKCSTCYTERKTTDTVQKLNRQVQSNMMSLETRTKAMEDKFSNIELVIDVAAKDIVKDAVAKALDDVQRATLEEAKRIIEAHVKEQTDKWQMQLVKMNNRILTLTQELELDD